jgi:hypothetical protein
MLLGHPQFKQNKMEQIFDKLRSANRKQGDLHVIIYGNFSGELLLNDEPLTSFDNLDELEVYLDNIITNGSWDDDMTFDQYKGETHGY